MDIQFLTPRSGRMIKEDGTIINGLATSIKELIIDEKLEDINIKSYAYPDEFIKHGGVEELEKIYGVDEQSIIEDIKKDIKEEEKTKRKWTNKNY